MNSYVEYFPQHNMNQTSTSTLEELVYLIYFRSIYCQGIILAVHKKNRYDNICISEKTQNL